MRNGVNRLDEFVYRRRFDHVTVRPGLQRSDGVVHILVDGEYEDLELLVLAYQSFNGMGSVKLRHRVIKHDTIGAFPAKIRDKVGEDIGLWRSEITGGGWQTIKTSSSSWSNQGLRYYKGLAWYRQTVDVPRQFAGKRVFFWCGGADELAKVWLNGHTIGISHGAAFYPFELDATDAVQAGENVIVVCVSNRRVNELGTGGIVAPVILYAPSAGKDAQKCPQHGPAL